MQKLSISRYLTHVQMSEHQRAKYLKWKNRNQKKVGLARLPLQKGPGGLALDKDGEKILLNPRTAGKPKFNKLSGNAFFSGYGSIAIRRKMAGELKQFFVDAINASDLEPITEYPIQIGWEIHCPVGQGNWDLDNLWFYKKFFIDALRDTGILREDTINEITSLVGPKFFPVDDEEKRKMVFTFKPDTRKCLS